MTQTHHIDTIILDDITLAGATDTLRSEREVVIADLIAENHFALPEGSPEGPYALNLTISENRLIIAVNAARSTNVARIPLPLKPFRTIIRDYFMICESYDEVVASADPRKVEAIDMGRRGIHNEGSELLRELLQPEIRVDFDTARRFFSLICVLHMKA